MGEIVLHPSRIRVKMCGMTQAEDVKHAIHLGVDAIGLIFYPKSTRYVSIEQAKKLLINLPPFIDAVAVLVNPERDEVQQIIDTLPVQLLQFHGDESPEFCEQFSVPYIKAIHPVDMNQIRELSSDYSTAQALLLDHSSGSSRGGTGMSFDWKIIPKGLSMPLIVAGGLNEFNLPEAVKISCPYAVDVCSGIEAMPGIKDHIKMERFIKALWSI